MVYQGTYYDACLLRRLIGRWQRISRHAILNDDVNMYLISFERYMLYQDILKGLRSEKETTQTT